MKGHKFSIVEKGKKFYLKVEGTHGFTRGPFPSRFQAQKAYYYVTGKKWRKG